MGPDHFAMPLAEMVGQPVQIWYTVAGAAIAREVELLPLPAPPLVQAMVVDRQSVTGTLTDIDVAEKRVTISLSEAGPVSLRLGFGITTGLLKPGMRVRATYVIERAPRVIDLEVLGRPKPPLRVS